MGIKNNFDTPVDRTGSCCLKWDRRTAKFQESDILPLWIADTDFVCPPQVTEAIAERCNHPIFGYSFTPEHYYSSIINWFQTRHRLDLNREWMRAQSGVLTSISCSIQVLTRPGDKVLIQTPVYDPFCTVTESNGRVVTTSPLIYQNNTYVMDYEDLETQFKSGVRLMILCNPHNPVGRVWTESELKQLVQLCVKYQVYLISDEIHCDFGLFGNWYTSILAFPEIHPLTICCIAPGKTFNLSGLAISTTLIPNPQLNEALGKHLRGLWLLSPSILSIAASTAAYTYGGEWMDEQLRYLEANSRFVQDRLSQEAPHIFPATHEGTFLMWLNFREFGMEPEELFGELVHTWHLGMNEGRLFGLGGEGFMRMNIGCNRSVLSQAVDQLVKMHQVHFPAN